jgi:predicted transcriptional regulator of viral defense system
MAYYGSKERLRRVAERQQGRVTSAQLEGLGVARSTTSAWRKSGYLTRVLPRVYAVGHTAPSRDADLWAAILYAGPGGMLSHATAAQWRGLIDYPPRVIEVTTPRKIKSTAGVRVYAERHMARDFHNHVPVTPTAQTVVDLAATSDAKLVRRALAVLDYTQQLDIQAFQAICHHGRPGSELLNEALPARPHQQHLGSGLPRVL